jgi:transcription initiation factor TFIIA large subunit
VGSDVDEDSEEREPDDFIVCQFEKVERAKNKRTYKCQLKDGIMHINGRDHLFSKASCKF